VTARNAIEIDNISKVFHLSKDPVHSLKERLLRLGRGGTEDFRALHPLTVDIPEGQTVGILGHNGSGKSTLLKCIAGILSPTTGEVRLRGRLASLLELGAGFHPELSGRENVFINAAFLGISRREIQKKFDDIVEFAELAQFIDEPVKHYSSGMYVRLGFAVAVNLDPDILLVDEVLAVGDEVFQLKCINRVKQFQREGRTIVFVTHAADTVREICDRALVLDHGELVADGAPGESIRIFREHLHGHLDDNSKFVPGTDSPARIAAVALRHPGTAGGRSYMTSGDPLTLTISYETTEPIDDAIVEIEFLDRSGRLVHKTDTDRLSTPIGRLDGTGTIEFTADQVALLDGDYPLSVRLSDRAHNRLLDLSEGQHRLTVVSHDRASGLVSMQWAVNVTPAVTAPT
jgi:ABC-2 type transport system ATP-binding protein